MDCKINNYHVFSKSEMPHRILYIMFTKSRIFYSSQNREEEGDEKESADEKTSQGYRKDAGKKRKNGGKGVEGGEKGARVYFKSVVSVASSLPGDDDARAKEA